MSEWSLIEHHLEDALDDVFMTIIRLGGIDSDEWSVFVADAQKRYEAGRAEHAESDSTWDAWTMEEFVANIREELLDCVIYAAARLVREAAS